MTELFINSQRVVLDETTKVKVKSENVYFTQSGKYTYDIEIPLDNPINSKIFGHFNLLQVSKITKTYNAVLISGNKVIISGIAAVTGGNEKAVTIQILSGNAEFNYRSKIEKLYIDELDLGKIEYKSAVTGIWESNKVFIDIAKLPTSKQRYERLFGVYGKTDFVCYPVYSESDDKVYNDHCIRKTSVNSHTIFPPRAFYSKVIELCADLTSIATHTKCAPQPYFCFIIRKIYKSLGYTVIENQIEDTILKNVFICNSNPTLTINKMLPHWTVNEFQTQIENFFGVVIIPDDSSKTIRVLLRDNYYERKEIQLNKIYDEYTLSCDEDETSDLSNGNIGYVFETVDPYDKIDNEVLKNAELKVFDTNPELTSFYNSLDEKQKGRYIYECIGRQYIHYTFSPTESNLKEVNKFRDLIRNPDSDNTDIELKIVPVRMKLGRIKLEGTNYDNFFKHHYATAGTELNATMMHVTGTEQLDESNFNVQEAIEGETNIISAKGVIEVAMTDGELQTVITDDRMESHSFAWPFVSFEDIISNYADRGFSFELNKVQGRKTMYDFIYGVVSKVNTQSEIYIKFITDELLDVMQLFIINNKKYVCKMIEYEIDAQEIKPEKAGYFYEYKE